jgi:two-component system response regulator LytT
MRVLIVEDEATLANRLHRLTTEILGDKVTRVTVATDIDDADEFINENCIDLLLLDLNLKSRDGFQLLKQSVAGAFHTIVVSANVHRAIEAFEYGVLDFVAKPFSKARLASAFARYNIGEGANTTSARYLSVKYSGLIEVIAIDQLLYIKGASNYSELYLTDGTTKLHSKSLNQLMALLPKDFERIHRSYIVPMSTALKLQTFPGVSHQLTLRNGTVLPVSRSKAKELRQLF